MRQKEKSWPQARAMWAEAELRALVDVWSAEMTREQARVRPKSTVKLSAAIHRAFLERSGQTSDARPLEAVTAKRNQLRFLHDKIRAFNEEQERSGARAWHSLPRSRRRRVRRGWAMKKSTLDLSENLFNRMTSKFAGVPMNLNERRARARLKSADAAGGGASTATDSSIATAPRPVLWSYFESMKVAEARADLDLCRVKTRQRTDSRLYQAYLHRGGPANRTQEAVSRQACTLRSVYKFIAQYNKQARSAGKKEWHLLSQIMRAHLGKDYGGPKTTLALVDYKMFQVLSGKSSCSPKKPTSHYTEVSRTTSTHNSPLREIRRVTESVKYKLSRGEEVVSVDQKRSIRSSRFVGQGKRPAVIEIEDEEVNESGESEEENKGTDEDDGDENSEDDDAEVDSEEECNQHQRIQRGRKRLRTRTDQEESSLQLQTRKRRRHANAAVVESQNRDYLSVLEDTVVTMSSQFAELDRQMTENRINENKRALVSVLRACRRSAPGRNAGKLAGDMLKRAGANMLEIAKLVNRQQERDGAVMERFLSLLHGRGGTR